jgi:hypothetical protein
MTTGTWCSEMFEDWGVVNRMLRAFHDLPRTVPALTVLQLQTKDFLRLGHLRHAHGDERYFQEVDKIIASHRRV